MLSEEAEFIYVVDIDGSTISKSKNKYTKDNIEFLAGSTSSIPLEDNSVEVVISFETIEQNDEMMIEIKMVC